MEGEQLSKGRDGMGLRMGIPLYGRGWSCGDQEGVDAEAGEDSIDIERGRVGRGSRGRDGGGEDDVFVAVLVRKAEGRGGAVVAVGESAFWLVGGSQGLVRLEGEVCPEVEVSGEVGEGGGEVVGVGLDGLYDVEAVEIEGGHQSERRGEDDIFFCFCFLIRQQSLSLSHDHYYSQILTISDSCVITATSRRTGFILGYTNCARNISVVPVASHSCRPTPSLYSCITSAASIPLSFTNPSYADINVPVCTPTTHITTHISTQFVLPVHIHSSACTGEYTPSSVRSSSPGVHISSCCTASAGAPFGGDDVDGLAEDSPSRKRTTETTMRHRTNSIYCNRPAIRPANVDFAAGMPEQT